MRLLLRRGVSTEQSTPGQLWQEGDVEPLCFTLEDVVREIEGAPVASWKVPGKTAIPRGEYRVVIGYSMRFDRLMPRLLNVPGYEGILIHSGNKAEQTEGCILVGFKHGPDGVYESRAAFSTVYRRIEEPLLAGEPVRIRVA